MKSYVMSQREINRLRWQTFGVLFVAILNIVLQAAGYPISVDSDSTVVEWALFVPIGLLNLAAAFLFFFLLVYYILHVLTLNDQLTGRGKFLWVALLFFAPFISMPIYWWRYVRPSPQSGA